ncbi:MAG: TRAP transporter substrate-binding protein DctP, partial [Desulfuromusa sp.]|nr:TRAP transporter substrate-binding protein DctP [Desulfuromusa sp.]
ELSLSVMWGANMGFVKDIVPQWNAYLDQATGGQVEIVVYPGGTLSKATEAYEGVVQGVSDLAVVAYPLTRGRFPVIETFVLPGIQYNNSVAASHIFNEGMKLLKPAEHNDAHFLWGCATGPGEIQSQVPVRNRDDLKGLTIAVNSGNRVDAMKLLGASPIMMPTPDWYEALQRGVMRSALIAGEVLDGYRQMEVNGDYVTVTPFLFNMVFGMVINQDSWNSLPADVQAALSVMPESLPPLWDKFNQKGYKLNAEHKTVEVIRLSAEQNAAWLATIKPVAAKHVADLDSKGLDGQKILKQVQDLADKYNKQYSDVAPYLN